MTPSARSALMLCLLIVACGGTPDADNPTGVSEATAADPVQTLGAEEPASEIAEPVSEPSDPEEEGAEPEPESVEAGQARMAALYGGLDSDPGTRPRECIAESRSVDGGKRRTSE